MKMSNRYFQLSNQEKKTFQVKLILLSLVFIILSGVLIATMSLKFSFLIVVVIALIISVVAPFFDVPTLVEKGKLTYHSLFLLAEEEKDRLIKIHGGTLFDYYFTFPEDMSGADRTKLVLLEFLKGLKHLIETTDDKVELQGTSYIINERTASKVGLETARVDAAQLLILGFNYLNLMISMSVVKRAVHFPNLSNVKTFRGSIAAVKARESYIDSLIEKLEA